MKGPYVLFVSAAFLLTFAIPLRAGELHDAVKDGKLPTVKSLLSKGADVNAKDKWGETPLHIAAAHDRSKIIELLVDKGADPNAKGKHGSPLHKAASRGKLNAAKALIAKGADIEMQATTLGTPLHVAARSGATEVIEMLIKKGANIHALDDTKRTPLRHAVLGEHLPAVELLVSKGAKLQIEDSLGYTLLHLAAKHYQTEVASFLVKHKLDVNAQTKNGQTPLDIAEIMKREAMVKLLLKHGGKPGEKKPADKTAVASTEPPLMQAVNALKAAQQGDYTKANSYLHRSRRKKTEEETRGFWDVYTLNRTLNATTLTKIGEKDKGKYKTISLRADFEGGISREVRVQFYLYKEGLFIKRLEIKELAGAVPKEPAAKSAPKPASDEPAQHALLGTWEYKAKGKTYQRIFSQDGNCTLTRDGKEVWSRPYTVVSPSEITVPDSKGKPASHKLNEDGTLDISGAFVGKRIP